MAWESSGQDGSGGGILARRFSSSGGDLGAEFQINQYTTGSQGTADISHDSSGGFVVTWGSNNQDGDSFGVFARRYDNLGGALGSEFQVNQYTTYGQAIASISHDGLGRFVVVWQSAGQDGSIIGVFGRRFSSSGGGLGAEFQVNQYTHDNQGFPKISHDPGGGFVVAWESYGQDGSGGGVFARRFSSSGGALGPEFRVNQYTPNSQDRISISHDSSGGFVMAWESSGQDGWGNGVFARRFSSSGGALGTEFLVNQYTPNDQGVPSIAHDSSGGFAVAWHSNGQDGQNFGVFARRYDSMGGALGAEFQVNQYTTSYQGYPRISHDSSADFVVAWNSYGQDGSGWGVFARLFPGRLIVAGPGFGSTPASRVRCYRVQ